MAARTKIQQFYKNKNVFLTGGTGFLGKALLEKMLRSTEVNCIYLLMRPKGGRNVHHRASEIFNDPFFEKLHQMHLNPMQRIAPIMGDCSLPNLGLSRSDRKLVAENVNVVLHSAATVRFNEPLSSAWSINVTGTVSLLELAKEMPQLQSFVHISTLFANGSNSQIDENPILPEVEETVKKLAAAAKTHGLHYLDTLSKEEIPLSYPISKAAAEWAVSQEASQLPVCIVRPGIISPTYKEPVSGWADNLYGPLRPLYDFSHGRLHALRIHAKTAAHLIPLDYCSNSILALAWNMAQDDRILKTNSPPIFNIGPAESNTICWSECFKFIGLEGPKFPLLKMHSYPFLKTTKSDFYFNILNLFYQIIPALLNDLISRPAANAKSMLQLCNIMNARNAVLNCYLMIDFTTSTENIHKLWTSLTPADQLLFPFDMKTLSWSDYFAKSLFGLRRYMGKEEPETIPAAVNLLKRLWLQHLMVKFCTYSGISLLLYWTILRNIIV